MYSYFPLFSLILLVTPLYFMAEPSPSDLPRSKPSTLAPETQKKKKNPRKKSDVKNTEQHHHHAETTATTKLPDNKLDTYADVINYINRLEHDVAIAKKQLKNQRQNFRKAISALAQHFDSQGISSDVITNYIQSLGKREAQVESLDESYEKFYSEYKYHIVQDPKNLAPKPQAKPKNKSTIEIETANPTENNLEIPKLAKENSSNKEPETEHQSTDKKKKKSTKEKATNGETEEAPKKRKYQKKPKQPEGEDKKAAESSPPEIQEIPSLTPAKDSAKNSAKKSAPRNEDSLRSLEEIPQLKQADMMKENKLRGDPYGDMGRYLNQLGMDPMSLMNMYMPMGMNMGNQEYYNKMMQELMKTNVMQNMLNMDQSRQDVFNHYQRNLK